MRKVFLDDLPRWEEGTYKGKIKWKESTGYKIKFIYENIEGELEVLSFDNFSRVIALKYNNKIKRINANHLTKCKIGGLLGKFNKDYIYSVGDIIGDVKYGKLKILEKTRMNYNKKYIKAYKYKCLCCTNEDIIPEESLKKKVGCNVCCIPSKKILQGYNDLWTTHPNIAKLLKDQNDGYKYSSGSNKKRDFKCSKCQYIIKDRIINSIVNQGLSCPKCSDGLSYPEKFMHNLLIQLCINFKKEVRFKWSTNKKYDFYIPALNCIIETHGMQHYEKSNRGRPLIAEQENDLIKEKLAIENGIKKYIVIDARYSDKDYIKNSILNSEISKSYDLSKIDWLKCHEFACKSVVKIVCDLWSDGNKNTESICNIVRLSLSPVIKYLKQGATLGWCDYDRKYTYLQAAIKTRKKIVQLTKNNEFVREWESVNEAAKHIGVKPDNVSHSLKNNDNINTPRTSGGFVWMYKDVYEKNKTNLKGYKGNNHHTRCIVRLDLKGNYIDEWNSIKEAMEKLDIHSQHISNVCKGRLNSTAGYKWMYKEDYDKYIAEQKEKEVFTT